jgi:RNA recognition motif-containing protein
MLVLAGSKAAHPHFLYTRMGFLLTPSPQYGKNVSTSLYVSNLPPSCTEEALAEIFARFGTVLSVRLKRDGVVGQKCRFGFVEMKTTAEARLAAQALNATRFENRLVSVSRAARS